MGQRAKGIGLRVSFLGGGNEENEEKGSLNDNRRTRNDYFCFFIFSRSTFDLGR
jgi:hypothetical protein